MKPQLKFTLQIGSLLPFERKSLLVLCILKWLLYIFSLFSIFLSDLPLTAAKWSLKLQTGVALLLIFAASQIWTKLSFPPDAQNRPSGDHLTPHI